MKKLITLALVLATTDAFSAQLCSSTITSVSIGPADWSRHLEGNVYKIDISKCAEVTINPFKSYSSLPAGSPKIIANRQIFNYPISFIVGNKVTVKGIGPKDFTKIPYFESSKDINIASNFYNKPLVSFTRNTSSEYMYSKSVELTIDYLRFQHNHGITNAIVKHNEDKKNENNQIDIGYMQALFVQGVSKGTLSSLEVIGSNSVLQIDSSHNVTITSSGIVCDYYCIAVAASNNTRIESSSVYQDYSSGNPWRLPQSKSEDSGAIYDIFRASGDQHSTIAVNAQASTTDSSTNNLTVSNSSFTIKTGVSFAVNSLVKVTNKNSESQVTLESSLIKIDKTTLAGNPKPASYYGYGWTIIHPNYGKTIVTVKSDNVVNVGGNITSGIELENSPLVMHTPIKNSNGKNSVAKFYVFDAYTPSHHALYTKNPNLKYSKVCFAEGFNCYNSSDRNTYEKVISVTPENTENYTEISLCKMASNYYDDLEITKNINATCDKTSKTQRVTTEKDLFSL